MKKYQLLGTKILVKRFPKEEKSGGLYVPTDVQKPPQRGRVLEVGPGLFVKETGKHWPLTVRPGDIILFAHYAGYALEPESQLKESDLIVLSDEDEILAIEKE